MKNAVFLIAGLAIGAVATLYGDGGGDLNDDGAIDLHDFSSLQSAFTGPLDREPYSFFASLPQPVFTDSVPGIDRFVVRSIVVSDGTAFQILEDGTTVFAYDGDGTGTNYVPHLTFPPDGGLVLSPGSELTITGSTGVTIMGYAE